MQFVRLALASSAALLALSSIPASAAVVVDFAAGSATTTPGTSVFNDFESLAAGTSLGTNASVFSDSVSGMAARPAYGSTGNFGAVMGGGTATFLFAPTSIFAFTLGSLDTYNTLTLLFEDGTSQVYNGGQIINGLSFPSGSQISGELNGQVSFTVNGGSLIKGVTFDSGSNSFEFDNLASGGLGGVPEPATWGLMILGLGATGTMMRRRRRVAVSYN